MTGYADSVHYPAVKWIFYTNTVKAPHVRRVSVRVNTVIWFEGLTVSCFAVLDYMQHKMFIVSQNSDCD